MGRLDGSAWWRSRSDKKEAVAATGTVSVTAAYGTVLAAGTVFAVPAKPADRMEAVGSDFANCYVRRE